MTATDDIQGIPLDGDRKLKDNALLEQNARMRDLLVRFHQAGTWEKAKLARLQDEVGAFLCSTHPTLAL